MADMTFVLEFIANSAKAMETIKQMQAAAKGTENGKQAAEVAKVEKSMKNAADAAKAQTKAAKETQAASKGIATEAAKAEASIRKQAEAGKAVATEVQATARAAEDAGRQEAARAEARIREIARRRQAYRDFDNATRRSQATARDPHWKDYWAARHQAEATAKAMKQAEAAARGSATAQRELAGATARTAQEAAKVEGRFSKIGQALRNVRWARVAGTAAAELSKGIAKSVTEAVTAGLRNAAASAPSIFRGQSLMSGGPGVRGAVQGTMMTGLATNQSRETAINSVRYNLGAGEAEARAAIHAADTAAATTGQTIAAPEMRAAAAELAAGQVQATVGLLGALADVAAASNGLQTVGEVARAYALANREGDISQFARATNATVKADEEGKQVLSYRHNNQDINRTIEPGDTASLKAAMDERLAVYSGAMARMQATPAGALAQMKSQWDLFAGLVMEKPFQYVAERMQAINAEMAAAGGMEAFAKGIGESLVTRLSEAEGHLKGIFTTLRDIAGPIDTVAQALGGWKFAIGGLVVLNFAGWLAGAAAGIKGVATASALLAASPAGRVLVGVAAAGYLLNEAWTGAAPAEGSFKAKAQAEMAVVKKSLAELWTWANTPLNQSAPTPPITIPSASPGAEAARTPGAQEKQAQAVASGEQAVAALAAIEAVAPAARAMVVEVTAILSAANFHSHGVAMMQTLAAGIRAGSAAAVQAVRETTQAMRDHLPHSPAKTGPLSDLDRIRFSETLAAAIRPAPAIAAVLAVAAGMRAALPASLALGIGATAAAAMPQVGMTSPGEAGSVPVMARAGTAAQGNITLHYAPTIHLPAGANAADFAAQLEAHKTQIAELVEGAMKRRSDLKFD